MLGLIGTLEMAKRSLDTTRQGIELTGHNLSNVSNPAYARQRLKIQTSNTIASSIGPTGTGAKVVAIEQLRNKLLDSQILTERGVTGSLEAQQSALQFGEINLGQLIDRQASSPEAATAAEGVGGQSGLVQGLTDYFNALQALSTSPGSTADRQVVLLTAQSLAQKFNTVDSRLTQLRDNLNASVEDDVTSANQLLDDVADLSLSISASELADTGAANDLRDRRQQKLEALGKLVDVQTSEGANKSLNLTIGGVTFISENEVQDTLSTTTDADGATQVATDSGAAVTLTSGSMYGSITARDGAIRTVQEAVNTLATTLITRVNAVHSAGFAMDGVSTGEDFFTGTDATDITLNQTLLDDPSKIQASADENPGNNEVALALAQLGAEKQSDLGNLSFIENYNQTVATFGQKLSTVNSQIQDQETVTNMLESQRDSIGGVSIDEEVTNMLVFQRAFQASSKMISTVDELLQTVINLSR